MGFYSLLQAVWWPMVINFSVIWSLMKSELSHWQSFNAHRLFFKLIIEIKFLNIYFMMMSFKDTHTEKCYVQNVSTTRSEFLPMIWQYQKTYPIYIYILYNKHVPYLSWPPFSKTSDECQRADDNGSFWHRARYRSYIYTPMIAIPFLKVGWSSNATHYSY